MPILIPDGSSSGIICILIKPISMKKDNKMGLGMAMGVGVGAALGVALDNLAVGVAVGIGVGIVFGAAWARRTKDDQEKDE